MGFVYKIDFYELQKSCELFFFFFFLFVAKKQKQKLLTPQAYIHTGPSLLNLNVPFELILTRFGVVS